MDITITWANGGGYQTTDGWNVLYREHTLTNTNNWILATDPDLPASASQYTITGLTPNILYDIAVVKSCASVFDQMSQKVWSYMDCPIVSTWQGPVVNGKPTLFYSVYYEEGTDIGSVDIRAYETTPRSFQIVDAVGNGTNILFTTGSVHDLNNNDTIVVSGVNSPGFNGTYSVISKTATTFTVASAYMGVYAAGTGTVTYNPGLLGDILGITTKINSVIGKTVYQTINPTAAPFSYIAVTTCATDTLQIPTPNSLNSVAGYFGIHHSSPIICGAAVGQNGPLTANTPILFEYNTTLNPKDYRVGTVGHFDLTNNIVVDPNDLALGIVVLGEVCPSDSLFGPAPLFTFDDDATQPYRNLNVANSANISAAICFDPLTGTVDYTLADGLGRTNINDYIFSFTTSDGVNTFPLLDNAGNPVTSYNGTYNIYAPVKIQSASVPSPGGGNPLGYTITNAVTVAGSTTYTYTGGTNAFTVGQDVFVSGVNPTSFNFLVGGVFSPRTITAATANTFTVTYTPSPALPYQTGGTASGFLELTDGMTITVDLLPGPTNVITLTNQNYAGLTLIQALNAIANSINTTTSYTALAVIVGGYPYLKVGVPGTTYTSASIKFEGPNILTKGTPDILQIVEGGTLNSTTSSVNYNGFLYTSFVDANRTYAKIVASSYTNIPAAATYSHTINTGIRELLLVPEVPPSTVYSLDHVTNGGDYSLNIATDSLGYSYIADNTTVSIYDGTTFIDSQDLSALPGGPTTPIRLMEFNTNDNKLYVFVDGSTNNFHIVDPAPWNIDYTGTYAQTNYLTRGTITAWNNLTAGPTAAMGTITSAPPILEKPILCSTMPCACNPLGPPNPVGPPCAPGIPNWVVGRNDGVRSELFQDSTKNWLPGNTYDTGYYYVYNYDTQQLGIKTAVVAGDPYRNLPGIQGNTIIVSAAIDTNLTAGNPTYSSFASSQGNSYGLFNNFYIVDYNTNFTSRTWENTARYLIENGRNKGSNGFIYSVINPTYISPNSYTRYLKVNSNKIDKQITLLQGLDATSEYLLYEIKDGGTCYNSTSNLVYVSLDGGIVETIDSLGNVLPYQLYKDFTNPSPSNPVQVPLQMVADPNSNKVYGIARDARSDVDDMNIYVLDDTGQIDVIQGFGLWNVPICGQISIDSTAGILYFTGKHTRNFYEYDLATGLWDFKIVPSLYEKMGGFTYGTASPLSRLQGIIERVQGATYIGGGKFVVMNYMQQTFSTELKYVYESSNIFVYDYVNNTIEQTLIGTGINTYSGAPSFYNPDRYGESFGSIDYNTDYCYGGLGIKIDSNGRILWKKAISDQIYMSESHTESGVAQIWGSSEAFVIRIWNIQSDGTLQQSKRTILDMYSSIQSQLTYDSFYQRVLSIPNEDGRQFNIYNPKNLAGAHSSPSTIGIAAKTINLLFINGITPTFSDVGKPTFLQSVSATATEITYNVNPSPFYPGVFPHHYAVGDVITVLGTGVVPALPAWLQVTNATITSVTATSFTVANSTGNPYPLTTHAASQVNIRLSQYWLGQADVVIKPDNLGNVFIIAQNVSGTYPQYTSMFVKYKTSDLFSQRESPNIIVKSAISSPCSATPNGIFVKPLYTPLLNSSVLGPTAQGTLWMLGSRNPICYVNGITSAVYNGGNQTIRYDIPNSFSVGKVVDIVGVTPSVYNLTRVPIVAADPFGFSISYTGAAPPPSTPPFGYTQVSLSTNWVVEVVDITSPTLNTLATIDMTFANTYLDNFPYYGSFQYSAAENKIYLYYQDSKTPVFVFDTISNSLVRTSSFNRMVSPYTKLNYVYSLEDVNGVAYFSAATNTDTPSRRWFRLAPGDRTYQNNVHNYLNVSTTDVVGTTTDTYNLYNLTNMSDTFGQWKEITDTTWATIPSTISVTLGTRLEFVSFIIAKPLVIVRNLTQGTTFTSSSISGLPLFGILIDGIAVADSDVLEFEFTNPDNPSCPFINRTTIQII